MLNKGGHRGNQMSINYDGTGWGYRFLSFFRFRFLRGRNFTGILVGVPLNILAILVFNVVYDPVHLPFKLPESIPHDSIFNREPPLGRWGLTLTDNLSFEGGEFPLAVLPEESVILKLQLRPQGIRLLVGLQLNDISSYIEWFGDDSYLETPIASKWLIGSSLNVLPIWFFLIFKFCLVLLRLLI